jgi:hypothetical protein
MCSETSPGGMRVHPLKTWPEFFQAIKRGDKNFDVRKDDRSFAVGDCIHLREWDPTPKLPDLLGVRECGYTGRVLRAIVSYKLHGGRFGIDANFCVLGLKDVSELPG